MGNNADIVSGYIPEEDVVYQITAVGSCQGVRKVIRKTYVLGDDDSSGGGDSGVRKHWNYQVWYRLAVL